MNFDCNPAVTCRWLLMVFFQSDLRSNYIKEIKIIPLQNLNNKGGGHFIK
jgi:hypothetical protein